MDVQIIAGLGLFIFGVVLGAILQRGFAGDNAKSKRLEQKLAETQDAYTKYQAEVSAHFMDTARKVQQLNQSYRSVHEELAKGASRLCSDDEATDFLSISLESKGKGQVYDENSGEIPSMPMDYAPKEKPDEEGTLSENFGLNESANTAADATENAAEPDSQPAMDTAHENNAPPRV